ncbi:hypothetical protein SRHO_G00060930 [Serrasalmus rhombeus]
MTVHSEADFKLKAKWEADLGKELDVDWWSRALSRANSSSSCARLGLMQLKCDISHSAGYEPSREHLHDSPPPSVFGRASFYEIGSAYCPCTSLAQHMFCSFSPEYMNSLFPSWIQAKNNNTSTQFLC